MKPEHELRLILALESIAASLEETAKGTAEQTEPEAGR